VAEQIFALRVRRALEWRLSPGLVFVAPAVVVLFLIGIFPLLYSLWISLHTYQLTRPYLGHAFVGLGNYAGVLHEPLFWGAVIRTAVYAALTLPAEVVLGIGIAMMLHAEMPGLRGLQRAMRLVIIVPLMMTPAAVGLLGRLVFNREFGIFNYLLGLVHLGPVNWIGDPRTAMFTIALVDVWTWTPFVALVALANLSSVPEELYEAAVLERASGWTMFRHIMLPFLRSGLTAVLIIRTADIIRTFDAAFVLTRGGPGVSTELLSIYVERVGFRIYDLGAATAMGVLLLIATIVIANLFIQFVYQELEVA
jgi:multiple sugar transport system permease protein